MYYHTRGAKKRYSSFPKPASCTFCDPAETVRAIREANYFYIMPNRVFYSQWETRTVTDHLMIIPKAHAETLAELPQAARLEFIDLVSEYEQNGYDIFARSSSSQTRSVGHQHTHLIRTTDKPSRGMIYLRKPHVLIKM